MLFKNSEKVVLQKSSSSNTLMPQACASQLAPFILESLFLPHTQYCACAPKHDFIIASYSCVCYTIPPAMIGHIPTTAQAALVQYAECAFIIIYIHYIMLLAQYHIYKHRALEPCASKGDITLIALHNIYISIMPSGSTPRLSAYKCDIALVVLHYIYIYVLLTSLARVHCASTNTIILLITATQHHNHTKAT